jgi:hypothetical protein
LYCIIVVAFRQRWEKGPRTLLSYCSHAFMYVLCQYCIHMRALLETLLFTNVKDYFYFYITLLFFPPSQEAERRFLKSNCHLLGRVVP